jgi:hypothetical protein
VNLPTDWVPAQYLANVSNPELRTVDFNGDGREDLLYRFHTASTDDWYAYVYAGTAASEGAWTGTGTPVVDGSPSQPLDVMVMDINGDGLSIRLQ